MAAHSSVLAWRIPGLGEPGGLPSMGVAQSWTQLKQLSSSSNSIGICRWPTYFQVLGEALSIISSSAAAAANSLQSCPTLCDPRDGSPPGSPIPGILQARTLEWVAISFSNA